MVEDSGFRGPDSAGVVVRGDRVKNLGENVSGDAARSLLHEPEAQMDVPEQLALGRGEKERPAVELAHPADVVEQGRGEEDVRPQACVQLCRLAAERRHRDGVLDQPAGV